MNKCVLKKKESLYTKELLYIDIHRHWIPWWWSGHGVNVYKLLLLSKEKNSKDEGRYITRKEEKAQLRVGGLEA